MLFYTWWLKVKFNVVNWDFYWMFPIRHGVCGQTCKSNSLFGILSIFQAQVGQKKLLIFNISMNYFKDIFLKPNSCSNSKWLELKLLRIAQGQISKSTRPSFGFFMFWHKFWLNFVHLKIDKFWSINHLKITNLYKLQLTNFFFPTPNLTFGFMFH